MGKVIVAFIVLWAVIYLVSRRFAKPRIDTRESRPPHDVRVVRCAHCGVHVPEPEAIRSEGRDYCSMEHRSLGPRGY